MFFLASGGEADDIIGWWIAGSGGGDDGLRTASNKIERRLSDVINGSFKLRIHGSSSTGGGGKGV